MPTTWIGVIDTAIKIGLGSLIGGFFSLKLLSKQYDQDTKKESNTRRLSALYRRIDQAEEFIFCVSEDFHKLRHSAIFILEENDPKLISERLHVYANWRDSLDKRYYAQGASIKSLSNKKLYAIWSDTNDTFTSMRNLYGEIYNNKINTPHAVIDTDSYYLQTQDLYDEFNQGFGDFISVLDSIRAGSPLKTIE